MESVYYEISGASAQFVINIYQDVGAELKSVSFGGKIHEFSRSGNKYKSKSVRIYDLIAETEIIVTVGDEEKRIVYSMENYISYLKSQGENTELVEAMYAFGVAAKNYKSSR